MSGRSVSRRDGATSDSEGVGMPYLLQKHLEQSRWHNTNVSCYESWAWTKIVCVT